MCLGPNPDARTAVASRYPKLKDNPDYTSIINELLEQLEAG